MTATGPTRQPRVRPAFRYLAIVASIILTPIAAHAIWDHIEVRRLVREVQAIQARGEPLTERDAGLTYRGTTDEHRRASEYYLAAAMLAPQRFAGAVLSPMREWVHGVPPARSRDELLGELSRLVDDRRDALGFADQAGALEFAGFAPGTEFSYRAYALEQVAILLAARTMLLSLSDDGDAAVASALSALHARRVPRQRWINRGDHETPVVLSFSSPSPAALQRLQAALEAEEDRYDRATALMQSRAVAIEMIWRRYYGPDPNASSYHSLPQRSLMETIRRPWITRQTVATLQRWAETIDLARRPWTESSREIEAVAARLHEDVQILPHGRPAQRLGPIEAFYRGSVLAAADPAVFLRDRCARAAVAVERFRRDHDGALPETLGALIPDYLAEIPRDPLSGAPLLYRSEPGAYTIYSVGLDRQDDGGDIASELHDAIAAGRARRDIRGRDIGVRVLVR